MDFYGLKWGDNPPAAALDRVYATYGSTKPIMIGETAAADCSNYAAGTTMTIELIRFFRMLPLPDRTCL